MTEDRPPLAELLAKAGDGDFLRSVAEAVVRLLMGNDVDGLIPRSVSDALHRTVSRRHMVAQQVRVAGRPDPRRRVDVLERTGNALERACASTFVKSVVGLLSFCKGPLPRQRYKGVEHGGERVDAGKGGFGQCA